ncbi:HdeD family acid-resistance protein [Geodermatophilus ruber]|uniref:Uncharacterized membrane protein HdeD, DUF308 family n=1 Tax=Geodermatophilus ruber TaxID=504800 RepID=A0A1I4BPD5_9ACTN|nr:DUF308 domain-containing protein [Geodermatophilus ruber]SFK69836.1 Uncharacterized membrane protein HdeD, DUF308 family [Geodermatophilus ruber]
MTDDISQVRGTGRALLERGAARWWWALLVAGLVWFVIGWLVLRADYTSLATVGVLVGIVFLIAAVSEGALAAVVTGGWKVWHLALAALFVLGAIWAFVRPVDTFFALASMLGLLLFIQGFFYITEAFVMRDASPYWWLGLTSGGLLVLLALWISTSDRVWTLATRSAFILLWVGFMAVFRGIRDIALAFELRRVGQQAEARLEEAEAPFVPAQERRTAAEAPHARQP